MHWLFLIDWDWRFLCDSGWLIPPDSNRNNIMKLYHVTSSENVGRILHEGLIPSIGGYAESMGETQASVWLFPTLEDAEEMAPVWLEPYYGDDLTFLEVELDDDFPLEYTGSDYEVVVHETIPPDNICIFDKSRNEPER